MYTLQKFTKPGIRKLFSIGETNPTHDFANMYDWGVSLGLPNREPLASYATDKQIVKKFSEKTGIPVNKLHEHHYYLQELFNPKDEGYVNHRLTTAGRRLKKRKTRKR